MPRPRPEAFQLHLPIPSTATPSMKYLEYQCAISHLAVSNTSEVLLSVSLHPALAAHINQPEIEYAATNFSEFVASSSLIRDVYLTADKRWRMERQSSASAYQPLVIARKRYTFEQSSIRIEFDSATLEQFKTIK